MAREATMPHEDEGRAFLEAIREAPEDDTPRLVYADWLDDHGDEARAEFVRLQCELARLGPKEERRAGLEQRERQLLASNRGTWLGPLAKVLHRCTFSRGFPEDLTVRPRAMIDLAEEFDRRVPAGLVTLYGGFSGPALK